MNLEDVTTYLRDSLSSLPGIAYQFHEDGYEASVRIWRIGSPEDWAEISSPGAMWVRLAATGGFMLIEPDDRMSDAELMQTIDEFLALARAYLAQQPTPQGRFFPSVSIESPNGPKVLKRSLISDLRHIFLGR